MPPLGANSEEAQPPVRFVSKLSTAYRLDPNAGSERTVGGLRVTVLLGSSVRSGEFMRRSHGGHNAGFVPLRSPRHGGSVLHHVQSSPVGVPGRDALELV